jgi:2-amino-4-hydroxy-6-hydroxymethyldihydropteridine diphosphokinase
MTEDKIRGPVQACLGLGSNIHPGYNLIKSVEFLGKQLKIVDVSNVWETTPVGTVGPKFLNAAVLLQTNLNPKQLKFQISRPIEIRLGRVRTPDRNAPRTIDIDLLIWNDLVVDPELLDHAYIAVPVAEVMPDFIPQGYRESMKSLAHQMNFSKSVVKCKEFTIEF